MSIQCHLARRLGYNLFQAPVLLLTASLLIATCVAERGEVDGRFSESTSPAGKKDRLGIDAVLDVQPEKEADSASAPSQAKSPPEKSADPPTTKPDQSQGDTGADSSGNNESPATKAYQASKLNWQHFSDSQESESSSVAAGTPSAGATSAAQSPSNSSPKKDESQESIGEFIADADAGAANSSANSNNPNQHAVSSKSSDQQASSDSGSNSSGSGKHESQHSDHEAAQSTVASGDDAPPAADATPAHLEAGDNSQHHDTNTGDEVKSEGPPPSTSEPAQPDNGSGVSSGDIGSKQDTGSSGSSAEAKPPGRQPEAQQDTVSSGSGDNGGSQGPWVVNLAQGPVATAVLSQGNNNMQIVDVEQLQKSQDNLDRVLADTEKNIAKSLTSLYASTSKHVQGEAYKMFDVVKLMHSDGEDRVRLLLERERRLQVTMMHGQYGKCCCTPGSEPDCSWSIAPKLLGDFSRKCEMTKNAYTEFLGEQKAGALEDKMLDQCSQAPDWLKFTSNQIVNDCDKYSDKLSRDMNTLGSYYGTSSN